MSRGDDWPAPPGWLRLLAAGIVLVAVLMTYAGAWRTGVAWDETYHVMRMQSWLDHGWYLLPHELDRGRPAGWLSDDYYLVYAPVTMVLLHGLGLLAGTDSGGAVSATAEAFALRHLGVATLGLLGLWAVYRLSALVARSWALVATALCAAIGLWSGSAMFNIKDVPVATGYTVFTLGVASLAVLPVGRASTVSRGRARRSQLAGMLLVAVGATLAMGTRPGIWPGLVAVVVIAVALRRSVWLAARIMAGVAVAWAILLSVYPAVFAHPLALLGAMGESAHFRGATSPWWYVPRQLLGEIPLATLILAVIGAGFALRAFVRERGRLEPHVLVLWLVGVQALALPVVAMLSSSHLYNGLRQLLFLVPALAVLAGAGAACAVAGSRGRGGARRLMGAAVVVVALVVPTASQALLWPYNYAYESPVGMALSGGDDTDWWRTSVRELAPALPPSGRVVCSPLSREGHWRPYASESHENCATALVGPLAPYADQRAGTTAVGEFEFVAVQSGSPEIGANCRPLAWVRRWVNWSREVMSTASVCAMELSDYPAGGLSFAPPSNTGAFELGAFAQAHDPRGKQLTDDSLLGLTRRPSGADAGLLISVTMADDSTPTLEVNGSPVDLVPMTAGEQFAVWQGEFAAELSPDGRMLLRLGPAGSWIRSLSVVDAPTSEEPVR